MKVTARVRRRLEVITNLAVLLVCLMALVALLRVGATARLSSSRRQPSQLSVLEQGQVFHAASALHITGRPALIVALNTNCHFCAESLPFYRQLKEEPRDATAPPVIMIFPNSRSEVKAFLRGLDSDPLSVFAEQDFAGFGISGTPTVVLLNANGVIRRVWTGKLSADEEQEIMNIAGLAAS